MSMRKIEAVYPLSPLQQGLLFHSLYAPESGVYVEQMTCVLEGRLRAAEFERAWQTVVNRHAVLRTSFAWKRLEKPMQVVHSAVPIRVEQEDWRGASEAEQGQRMGALLLEDMRRGFDISKPPLMRLLLVRTGDESHRFLWSHHHLLLDGWCMHLLVGEVLTFYEAYCRGEALNLPLPRPYQDYIAWLNRQDIAAAENFWRRTLGGFARPTRLPFERVTDGLETREGFGEQEIRLSAELSAELRATARRHRLTLNTLVQGAWALLLSRYGNEDDVVFGTTVSGRPPSLEGVETMIGLFINTLPLRVRVRDDASVSSWLGELQRQRVELQQYEYSPLGDVQKWSELPRGSALFKSILVFENYPVDNLMRERKGSLQVKQIQGFERANYPIGVVIGPDRELLLRISYSRRHFNAETIGRLLRHFEQLLGGLTGPPDRRLSELPMLTEEERRQVLVEFNRTSAEYPSDATIHGLFERQAALTPSATALAYEGGEVTYAELDRRSEALAGRLRRLGVGAEQRVGLVLERSAEMVTAVLAVLKAGGAYVPIDPAYPAERQRLMLEDADVRVVLTQRRRLNDAPTGGGWRVLAVESLLDDGWQEGRMHDAAAGGGAAGCAEATADNLAYVIYTSGSTGRPKGVAVQHRSVVSLSVAQRREFGLGAEARVLQFSSPSFDASVWEMVMALTNGASLWLWPAEKAFAATDLAAKIREWGVNVATLPPSLLTVMSAEDLPRFHTVITGGEACPAEAANRWSPGRRFFNVYGPTEATCVTTVMRCAGTYEAGPPIGRPIANMEVYVLDTRLRPLPVGVNGELYVGGAGLARGYLGRPALTAERFIPHPFAAVPGARLYRTGDLVRLLPDGALEFVGRVDRQVKVRGFRIELGEIEAALLRHPGVAEAVVVARETGESEKQLLAYLVAVSRERPTAAELRKSLAELLPEYMIPAHFILLERFPLNPNGKVDKDALPAFDGEGQRAKDDYVGPQSDVQKVVAEIWRQVLGLERVGIHDAFFEVGGDSLRIIRVFEMLKERFPGRVAMADLFKNNTIASISAQIEEGRPEESEEFERVEI